MDDLHYAARLDRRPVARGRARRQPGRRFQHHHAVVAVADEAAEVGNRVRILAPVAVGDDRIGHGRIDLTIVVVGYDDRAAARHDQRPQPAVDRVQAHRPPAIVHQHPVAAAVQIGSHDADTHRRP